VITILGADWCPACKRAIKVALEHDLEYNYVRIPEGPAGWALVESLTGERAIPQIFFNLGNSRDFTETLNSLNLGNTE